MSTYNIDEIFNNLSKFDTTNCTLDERNYEDYLNKYIEIANPDYVAVLTTKSLEPILFEKNFNLKFEDDKQGTLQDIIECASTRFSEQSRKTFELDSTMMKFAFDNSDIIESQKNLYSIKFLNELTTGNIISLRRDISLLSKDKDGLPHIILVAWFDVTALNGINPGMYVNAKDFGPNKDKNASITLELNKKLNSIVSTKIQLTKREKQILQLISEGNTSAQIANYLNISKATVDTHRQNIIKKNNVNNTSAIIKSI